MKILNKIKNKVDRDIVQIINELQSSGYETYIVGGAIRDIILNREPKDYDISTSATPEEIKKVFKKKRRVVIIGRRFKLAHLYNGKDIIEISTFRQNPKGTGQDKRNRKKQVPKNMIFRDNEYGSSYDDAFRRDFTVNALFYDPIKNKIIDYTEMGLDDLKNKIVRIIGNPDTRFEEDPVRTLRALKLVGQYNFTIEKNTKKSLDKKMSTMSYVAKSRLLLELDKILKHPYGYEILKTFANYDFLKYILPTPVKEWNNKVGKQAQILLKERCARLKEKKYRNSVSVAIATIALPYVEKQLSGKIGDLWEDYYGINKNIMSIVKNLFAPHIFPKVVMYAVTDIIMLQPPLFNKKVSDYVMLNRRYNHARELMIIQNNTSNKDHELEEIWKKSTRRHYNNKGQNGRNRKDRR